jgi:hypothetical protein
MPPREWFAEARGFSRRCFQWCQWATRDILSNRLPKKAHLRRWTAWALAAAYPQVRLTRPFALRLASGPF